MIFDVRGTRGNCKGVQHNRFIKPAFEAESLFGSDHTKYASLYSNLAVQTELLR